MSLLRHVHALIFFCRFPSQGVWNPYSTAGVISGDCCCVSVCTTSERICADQVRSEGGVGDGVGDDMPIGGLGTGQKVNSHVVDCHKINIYLL